MIIRYCNRNILLVYFTRFIVKIIILVKDSCKITKENIVKIIDKTNGAINLKENEWHEIEANEDNTIFVNIMPNIKTE